MTSGPYFTVPFEMGKVVIRTGDDDKVTGIEFDLEGLYAERRSGSKLERDIHRYFEGQDVVWQIELDLEGATDFTRRVYESVARIPRGQIRSYGDVARDVRCPSGARAVGQVMARNRFPLVIPCHRVVGSDMSLGGFSSGPDLKRYLLRMEGVLA